MKNCFRLQQLFASTAVAAIISFAATTADAKIVLLGDDPNGWEFSFDGSVNAFVVNTQADATPSGTRSGGTGLPANGVDQTRVRNGLLPTVFGLNAKSPKIDGTTYSARIGLYPSINDSNTQTSVTGQMDLREAFFTAAGDWGGIQGGRALNQFQGANILNDMTLLGVGVSGNLGSGAVVTLGRIGYGYVYPQFGASLRYTTPERSGMKASIGVYDPSIIARDEGGATAVTNATETETPEIQGNVSWGGNIGGGKALVDVSGMWQQANFASGSTDSSSNSISGNTVNAWGLASVAKYSISGFTFTAGGFLGEALGTAVLQDEDALDIDGNEKDHAGYYIQGQYDFRLHFHRGRLFR